MTDNEFYTTRLEKISDLEDKLYHATREVDEVKYLLGHKIELLEKQNKIMRDALEFISKGFGIALAVAQDGCPIVTRHPDPQEKAIAVLKEIEGLT